MDNRLARVPALLVLAGALAAGAGAWAADDDEPATVPAKEEVQSSPEEFLALVRSPFQDEAWGRFSGQVVHVQADGKEKAAIALAIVFGAESTKVRVVLNEQNTYGIEQVHGAGGPGRIILKMPEPEQKPGLSDLGLQPDDITMAFIYWDFIRELPTESLRQQPCRLLAILSQ